jgi:hypothetical protein
MSSFATGHVRHESRLVPLWEEGQSWSSFKSTINRFYEMIVQMAEAKKELVWVETAFFMGWGCSNCTWRDLIPRDIPTLLSPSDGARRAFRRHKCNGTPRNNPNQPNTRVQARRTVLRRF